MNFYDDKFLYKFLAAFFGILGFFILLIVWISQGIGALIYVAGCYILVIAYLVFKAFQVHAYYDGKPLYTVLFPELFISNKTFVTYTTIGFLLTVALISWFMFAKP